MLGWRMLRELANRFAVVACPKYALPSPSSGCACPAAMAHNRSNLLAGPAPSRLPALHHAGLLQEEHLPLAKSPGTRAAARRELLPRPPPLHGVHLGQGKPSPRLQPAMQCQAAQSASSAEAGRRPGSPCHYSSLQLEGSLAKRHSPLEVANTCHNPARARQRGRYRRGG